MGAISRMFQPQAAMSSEDLRRVIGDGYGYGTARSGVAVTPNTAMKCSAVFACINVISQTVAQLPLVLYRKTPTGKEMATDHPLYNVMALRPNDANTSFAFREMLTAHNCLRGNSFAFINRVGNGRIYELLPLHPDYVSIARNPSTWEVTYTVNEREGIRGTYTRKDIFHLMGMTLNGYEGITPLTYARESIGLSLGTEKFGAQLFGNGAKPGGHLKYPGRLKTAEQGRAIADAFDEVTSGENAHKTVVLEEGMEWVRMGLTSEDSQFLETRQFQIPEVARFFRMPLHKIQDLTRSTNNNIEHQSLEFLTDTMMPWFVRWEQSMNMQLLTPQEQQSYFFKFDVDDILRADMKSRFEAYASGIASEILNPNECREKEDMNPYTGGEVYKNRNTKPADAAGKGGKNGSE